MNQSVTLAERLQVGSQIMQGPDEDQGAEGGGLAPSAAMRFTHHAHHAKTPPELVYIVTEVQQLMDRLNLEPGGSLDADSQQEARKRDASRAQTALRRTHSAPATVSAAFHPENFMPIHLCQDEAGHSTCPIMLTEFELH